MGAQLGSSVVFGSCSGKARGCRAKRLYLHSALHKSRFFGGVYTPLSLRASAYQQSTPYRDSKFHHARTGMQKDARTAETLGTLNVNRILCACERCKAPLYDNQNCLVKKVVGAVTQKECKRVRGSAALTTQIRRRSLTSLSK